MAQKVLWLCLSRIIFDAMRSDLKVIWAKMSYHFGADEEWAPLREKGLSL